MMWTSGLPISVTGLLGGIGVTVHILGAGPAFAGLAVALFVLLLNFGLTILTGKVEHDSLALADKRVAMLTQILESARPIKFFVWEGEYLRKITEIRIEECKTIRKRRLLHVTSCALGRGSPVMSAAVAILAYHYAGNLLLAKDVFAVVTTFQSMRLPLIMAPLTLSAMNNAYVFFLFVIPGDHIRSPHSIFS